MIISHEHKFIYFDIPKTGSVTLDHMFMKYAGGIKYHVDGDDTKTKHARFAPHGTEGYFKIISVRNPIDRLVSWYYWAIKTKPDMPFKNIGEFVDSKIEMTLNNPSDTTNHGIYRNFPCWKYMEPYGYDYVIHLENIESNLKKLYFIPNNIIVPQKNSTKHPTWDDIKTPELRAKIILWGGKDFEQFGYSIP